MEICKTIKKKAREDIRKHNLDEIRETIEASNSLEKVRINTQPRKNRMMVIFFKKRNRKDIKNYRPICLL